MERVIFIASDHAGFDLKQDLVPWLKSRFADFKIEDLGTTSRDSVDYPDFASRLAQSLSLKQNTEFVSKYSTEMNASKSQPYSQSSDPKVAPKIEHGTPKKEPLNESFGILICGSGQGMAMRANKYPWIRAALVYSSEIAELSREHNDANVICLGARFCTLANAEDWIEKFLTKPFAGGRHATRVAKMTSSI